ncbi:hypothetical protein BgiMline_019478, partial [Biomphalaria glabrata]
MDVIFDSNHSLVTRHKLFVGLLLTCILGLIYINVFSNRHNEKYLSEFLSLI